MYERKRRHVHDVLVECYMHTVCCTMWPRLNAVEATTCTVVLVVSVVGYLIMVCVVFVISVLIVHSQ